MELEILDNWLILMYFEFGLLNIPVEGSFQVIERRVQVWLTLISILSVLTYKYMNKFIHDPMIIIALRAVTSGSYRDSEKYSSWIWWNGWIRNGDVILCHDTCRQTRQKGHCPCKWDNQKFPCSDHRNYKFSLPKEKREGYKYEKEKKGKKKGRR